MPKANKKAAAAVGPVMLYWVSTSDHNEDWFIVAKSKRSTARFHVEYEGYGSGEAAAVPILVASGAAGPFPRHAQIDDLAALGFVEKERLSESPPY